MRKQDCFYLGRITRRHGLKGEVLAHFDTDRPDHYTKLESVYLDRKGELVPFFIDKLDRHPRGHFILHFEDCEAVEVDTLIDAEIYLPLSLLPPLAGKQFYFHEIIGFQAIELEAGPLGEVEEVLDNSAQPLLKILSPEGQEILVPAVDEFIQRLDRQDKEIYLQLPEGLLEIFQT